MNSGIENLVYELGQCLTARVEGMFLVVWPVSDDKDPDTQLHLRLEKDMKRWEVTLRTGPDGQTPMVEREHLQAKFELADYEQRRWTWRHTSFWKRDNFGPEVFDAGNDPTFGPMIGTHINQVGLLHFVDEPSAVTGIELVLSSNKKLYSVPSSCGNQILFDLSAYSFPEPVETFYVVGTDVGLLRSPE